ncbi:hypothetical protein IWX90DRAFT_508403 [Phyllosticta citrichinensis]|uniref:Uncharacterized protein n=1 Tax=Phyllosticta citrichinensis TaxID=1130410 RepID=A0ABR1XM00_9PEZI
MEPLHGRRVRVLAGWLYVRVRVILVAAIDAVLAEICQGSRGLGDAVTRPAQSAAFEAAGEALDEWSEGEERGQDGCAETAEFHDSDDENDGLGNGFCNSESVPKVGKRVTLDLTNDL